MTRPEIESELGSKQLFTRQQVVDLIYEYGVIFDEELQKAKAELQAQAEERQKQWNEAFSVGLKAAREDAGRLGAELAVVWVADTVIGAGLIVYGIFRADPAVLATGAVLAGAGITRFVIYLK